MAYAILRPLPDVWTDDACVRVHYAMLALRVAGRMAAVEAADNQPARAGQVLTTVDPRDFATAIASAEAALVRDRRGSATPGAWSSGSRRWSASRRRRWRPPTPVRSWRRPTRALQQPGLNWRRHCARAPAGQNHTPNCQHGPTERRRGLARARRRLDVLKAQKRTAEGAVALDQALLEQARLNLSYTRVVAVIDGLVGEKSVQVANYVTPGTTLMVARPLIQVYIEANYRETDLKHTRAGRQASIHVDAYDVVLDGVRDSLPRAPGASFAPVAPNNATGNFTKIVQRLPIKIALTPGQRLADLLKVGLSVETTVHTGLEDVVAQERTTPSIAPAK